MKLEKTARTTLNRYPSRGSYDRDLANSIIDEALISHVAIVRDGVPFVLPMICARVGERLFIHGSRANGMLDLLRTAPTLCVTVTLIDGLVLSRTAFNHSMNYRSVMLLGQAREVTDENEKRMALAAVVEHVVPGRMQDVGEPTEDDLAATAVFELAIEEGSVKTRVGPPNDRNPELRAYRKYKH